MIKSLPPSLAMATPSNSEILSMISTLLARQASVSRPPVDVCHTIANLQGLLEIAGGEGARNSNWRRGAPNDSLHKWRHDKFTKPSHQQQIPIRTSNSAPNLSNTTPISNGPPPPMGRYQSKFHNSTQEVEDKILNNIILSKLNKFSDSTYVDVRDFLYQILGGGEADLQEFVRDFMRLVFRKAAAEEIFCPLYAKLLAEISEKYKVILEEMSVLSDNYLQIFEEVNETSSENYDDLVKKNIEKKYRLGYSQFLAELAKQEILPFEVLKATFTKLITVTHKSCKEENKKVLVEEYTDCLLRMIRILKGRTTHFSRNARENLLPIFSVLYNDLQENKPAFVSCSAKSRFAFMDIHDILSGR